uniref:Putative lipocal-1 1 n=1 Tax=Amblyomma cajennense TaxID=34607 RepID=A0A023FNQ4_AMBCJ
MSSERYGQPGEEKKVFVALSIITMPRLIPKATLFLVVMVAFIGIGAHAGRRIDDEPGYKKYQDVRRALNFSTDYWLFTVNFPRKYTEGRRCTVFHIEKLENDYMNYSSHYLVNGTEGSMKYVGKFFQTPLQDGSDREKNNGFYASLTSEKWHPQNYTLIYSDYEGCLILRVRDFYSGYACMVLVSEPLANNSMPWKCQFVYRNACNGSGIAEQIYERSCDKSKLLA